ncbi:hypothetical protein EJB05_47502, partial [Eragrostis curvula]
MEDETTSEKYAAAAKVNMHNKLLSFVNKTPNNQVNDDLIDQGFEEAILGQKMRNRAKRRSSR